VVVNSGIESYFQDPLKGITVSGCHSDKDFIVKVALTFKLILDVDNFGDMLHSIYIVFAILAEILYLKNFFLAEIFINDSVSLYMFIS
jgi:hypothetical protein